MDYNYFEAVCDDVREVIVLPDFEKYSNAANGEVRDDF